MLKHVVSGDLRAADVVTLKSAITVQGESVSIIVEGDSVRINDALVVITDIEASNGVILVIDTVLLSPTEYREENVPSPRRNPCPGSERRVKPGISR